MGKRMPRNICEEKHKATFLEGECLGIYRDNPKTIGVWRKEILIKQDSDGLFRLPRLYYDYFEIGPAKS
jgi:hypothetical protein